MNSKIVFEFLKPKLHFKREVFWVVGFDTNKDICCAEELFIGTINRCPVYPREIFRYALIHNAEEIVIAHTHTSINIQPSIEDQKITQLIWDLGNKLGLKVIDHLIIYKDTYFSFCDNNLLPNQKPVDIFARYIVHCN